MYSIRCSINIVVTRTSFVSESLLTCSRLRRTARSVIQSPGMVWSLRYVCTAYHTATASLLCAENTLSLQTSPKFPVCLLPLGLFRLDILKTPRIAHSLSLFGPSQCRRLTCRRDRNAAESLCSRPYNVALIATIAIEATMKGTVKRSLPQSHTHTYTHWHSTTSGLRFTLVVGVCWTYRNEDATRFPSYNTYMHCFVIQPPTHNSHSRSGEFLSSSSLLLVILSPSTLLRCRATT